MHSFGILADSPEVGSMFGQIGATGWKVRGHVGQKCPIFRNFVGTKMGGFWKFWDQTFIGTIPGPPPIQLSLSISTWSPLDLHFRTFGNWHSFQDIFWVRVQLIPRSAGVIYLELLCQVFLIPGILPPCSQPYRCGAPLFYPETRHWSPCHLLWFDTLVSFLQTFWAFEKKLQKES